MTPLEAWDDMATRCSQVWTFALDPSKVGLEQGDKRALGAIVRGEDASMLCVEIGQGPDGIAFVSAKAFDAAGNPRPVSFTEVGDTVLVTMA